ncbi:hypothetical protein I4U23_026470 [Adineta vaga]|nr:hypothetical protein I4U23_026470 [Adineta vaga]
MPLIHLKKILSCSSEDQIHCAQNLLNPDQSNKWFSSKKPEERITCIIEFDKPSCISSIDIDDWTMLLPSTLFMTPKESRTNQNNQQIKSLKSFHLNKVTLNKKWNRLKIICEQKFNRDIPFGLNFIKLYSNDDHQIEDETDIEQKQIQLERKSKITSKDNQNDKNTQIMKNVVFVLSGFQNPLRSELRNKATAMGAIYNDDWNEKCTHLILAFPNTPKFIQVQKAGNGFIVNQQWILDCHKQDRFLSESSYEFSETRKRKKQDEEESIETKKPPMKKKSLNKKEEKEAKKLKLGELPDFFHEKHFYVSYGDYNDNTLLDITRVILAYDGILERQITNDVTYVITNRMWNHDFEKISKSNPEINFVNLDWIQDCHNENQFVPIQTYLIVP